MRLDVLLVCVLFISFGCAEQPLKDSEADEMVKQEAFASTYEARRSIAVVFINASILTGNAQPVSVPVINTPGITIDGGARSAETSTPYCRPALDHAVAGATRARIQAHRSRVTCCRGGIPRSAVPSVPVRGGSIIRAADHADCSLRRCRADHA